MSRRSARAGLVARRLVAGRLVARRLVAGRLVARRLVAGRLVARRLVARRLALALALGLVAASVCWTRLAAAEQPADRWDLGLRFSFMPAGSFRLEYSDNHVGRLHSSASIMALGFGAFADCSFNPYLAVGLGGEAVLNVIPDVPHYEVGQMLNLGARLRLTWPLGARVRLYGLLMPGLGIIFSSLHEARGFTLTTTLGGALRLGRRNTIFVEVGYLAGFQRRTGERAGEPYGASYLVTSCGWQLSL